VSATQPDSDPQTLNLQGIKDTDTQRQRTFSERALDWGKRMLLSDYFILIISLLAYVIAAQFFDRLARPLNMTNQLSNMWPLFAVAIGQTFVLIIAGIDLAQGATMALASVVGAMIMAENLNPDMFDRLPLWGSVMTEAGGLLAGHPLATPVAVAAMLLSGVLVGFIIGQLITRFKITPFIASLVGFIFFSFLALWLTQSRNISGLPESFVQLGDSRELISIYIGEQAEPEIRRRDILSVVTWSTIITLSLAAVASYLLNRTIFGKHMIAIGTNSKAAEISGVPIGRVITLVYMFSGFCAAVAAILYSARLEIGQPTLGGLDLLLDIIGSCVIGGSSLFGGKGSIKGTFFGVVFFILLGNILDAARLDPFVIDAVKGIVILLAALMDYTRTRIIQVERAA
jgi:ribose/xylose/arabinose/galactoside ABC-type transport system permease subunit